MMLPYKSGYNWAELTELCEGEEKSLGEQYIIIEQLKQRDKKSNSNEIQYQAYMETLIISKYTILFIVEKIITYTSKATMEIYIKKVRIRRPKPKTKAQKHLDEMELINEAIEENKQNYSKELKKQQEKPREKPIKVTLTSYRTDGVESISRQSIQIAFESDKYVDRIVNCNKREKVIGYKVNRKAWLKVANDIYMTEKKRIPNEVAKYTPEEFYIKILQTYIIELFTKCVNDIRKKKLFEVFNCETDPLVICSFQKDINDKIPVINIIIPAAKMIEKKLIPKNCFKVNLFEDGELLMYGLFYSFSIRFNMFIGFFGDKKGNENCKFYSVTFDRHYEDIDYTIDSIVSAMGDQKVDLPLGQTLSIDENGKRKDITVDDPFFL